MGATSVRREVEAGNDVFGIPHGGYLAALVADAVLDAAGVPDLFTMTVHYLRKAAVGPLDVEASSVGGSRRFTTWSATARQDGEPVLAAIVSLGDRSSTSGPTWRAEDPWDPDAATLSAPAGGDGASAGFDTPAIANRHALRLDTSTVGFARGETGDVAEIRAVMPAEAPTVLDAIVGCDVTPPAVWNALGMQGWVPTLELTLHVRATPGPGPLRVRATTRHVADGLLEEDAEVHDADGRLVVQSRQLAIWTAA